MWSSILARLKSQAVKQTSLIFVLSLSFLIGVALAKTGLLLDFTWPLLAGAMALIFWRRRNLAVVILVIIAGVSFGWWRGGTEVQRLAVNNQNYFKKITIVASATSDATYGNNKQLEFEAKNALVEPSGRKLTGTIRLSGFGENMIWDGDRVQVTGKLYPARGNDQSQMSYGQIKILSHHNSLVSELRRRFTAGMSSALPPPLASFGMGLLIGQKVNLPDNVYQDLLMVGLVHIIAVSGYNLMILLNASDRLLGRRNKRLKTFLSLMLIGVFLLFTGSSPSIVRAAIIAILAVAAGYFGRKFKPLVLLMLAGAITGFMNPFYVWGNASWYLSFLAFFGVLVLAPMIKDRYFASRWCGSLVANVALESFCAELMTLPFVLQAFGQISFVAILANVIIAAFTPLAMLLSFIAGLAGMAAPLLAGWFAWPAQIVLEYMLDMAHLLAQIPHVFAQGLKFSITQLIVLYSILAIFFGGLWHKTKRLKPATIPDESREIS